MKISLRRRHAQTVKIGASSHKTNYVDIFSEILNLEGHLNRCIGSKVTAILLVKLHREGSALQPAQQACFVYITVYSIRRVDKNITSFKIHKGGPKKTTLLDTVE